MNRFSEENIQKIFGHEAAEDERPERLREYYFKGSAYTSIRANLPLRILVGHKGIGKSALFSVAKYEDEEENRLSISLRPDDIVELDTSEGDFNKQIKQWKTGLTRVIRDIVFYNLGLHNGSTNHVVNGAGKFVAWLKSTAKPYLETKADFDPTEKLFAELIPAL